MKKIVLVLVSVWVLISCNENSQLVGGQPGTTQRLGTEGDNASNLLGDDNTTPFTPTRPPTSSITQGSFTVWTVPDDPSPGENYEIKIQVEYPSDTTDIARGDLSGCMIGSDGYFYPIFGADEIAAISDSGFSGFNTGISDDGLLLGFDSDSFNSSFSNCEEGIESLSNTEKSNFINADVYSVDGNIATLNISIPGAEALVRDNIEVSSSILNERQEISIEF